MPASYARGTVTGFEAFEHYLGDDSRRGPAPDGAYSGAAGGALCGDLVRLSLAVERGRVAAARFDAEGCAATIAAGAAVAEAAEGASVLEAARIGPARVSAALGGLSPQGRHAAELAADALHRALGAAASSGEVLSDPPAAGERVLVAMSGGVDSAVAALLERRRGAEVVAVTLKLWADRHTDGARSCCSPEAVVGARELAHGLGAAPPDARPRGGLSRAPSSRASCAATRRGEPRTPAWSATGRCGSTRCSPSRGGWERRRSPPATTPAWSTTAPGRSSPRRPTRPRTRPTCSPRCGRSRWPRFASRSRDLTKARVRELAAGAGLPVATKRESQDLCFLAGEGKRSFLARHARLRERAGEIVDGGGRVVGRHRGHHNFTVGQRRGLGVAAGQPLYVLATDAAANRVVVGPRAALATQRVQVRDAVLLRDGDRVDRVKLRYRSRPIGCAVEAARRPAPGAVPGAGRARLRRRPRPDRLPDGRRAGRRARDDLRLDCGTP